MVTSVFINRLDVRAGQRIYLRDLNWLEFEQNIPIIEGTSEILGSSTDVLMSDSRREFQKWVRHL